MARWSWQKCLVAEALDFGKLPWGKDKDKEKDKDRDKDTGRSRHAHLGWMYGSLCWFGSSSSNEADWRRYGIDSWSFQTVGSSMGLLQSAVVESTELIHDAHNVMSSRSQLPHAQVAGTGE